MTAAAAPAVPAPEAATTVAAAVVATAAVVLFLALRRRDRVDFDAPVDRQGQHTVKHDLALALYGPKAARALKLWVADMDLPVTCRKSNNSRR